MGVLLTVLLASTPAPAAAITAPTARLFTEAEAPITRASALTISVSATVTGLVMMAASGIQLSGSPASMASPLVSFGVGFLLFNFGPNTADLLIGNKGHMLQRGLLRLALLVGSSFLIVLGPLGAVALFSGVCAWFAWCVADSIDAARAPQRWAARMNKEPAQPLFPILRF